MVFCGGATRPAICRWKGRDLAGVEFAMDFLPQQNKRVAGDDVAAKGYKEILATGKDVIVIGGGDTGSDCIGTSIRQGAKSVNNFELLPMPPVGRPDDQPWPFWPMKLRNSTSHDEGCERYFSILTKRFAGSDGKLEKLETVQVELVPPEGGGRRKSKKFPARNRSGPVTWPFSPWDLSDRRPTA